MSLPFHLIRPYYVVQTRTRGGRYRFAHGSYDLSAMQWAFAQHTGPTGPYAVRIYVEDERRVVARAVRSEPKPRRVRTTERTRAFPSHCVPGKV